ncbi:MAG: EamA family transporter, partial [Actinoplanes sp.]
ATMVSVVALLEVPGAALLAWVWLDQAPRSTALPGITVLLTGVVVVLLGAARANRASVNPALAD